ncbi:hypothetical protein NG99_12385 [Erwinia typographi]|uniref:Uncharacterized protein n=1 Tax=Erwinia typographi TaxID=371042 RepID=A0A0A4A566_9GAMM|nr:hypothetical protein [Erwinia typographi]KGT93003.1 hypothetical protein NG99_12385 [Erwinia typographi]
MIAWMEEMRSRLTIPVFSAETLGYLGALDDGNAYDMLDMPADYIYRSVARQAENPRQATC